jgi:hypothetical protein
MGAASKNKHSNILLDAITRNVAARMDYQALAFDGYFSSLDPASRLRAAWKPAAKIGEKGLLL